jgi:hypothetical protein
VRWCFSVSWVLRMTAPPAPRRASRPSRHYALRNSDTPEAPRPNCRAYLRQTHVLLKATANPHSTFPNPQNGTRTCQHFNLVELCCDWSWVCAALKRGTPGEAALFRLLFALRCLPLNSARKSGRGCDSRLSIYDQVVGARFTLLADGPNQNWGSVETRSSGISRPCPATPGWE